MFLTPFSDTRILRSEGEEVLSSEACLFGSCGWSSLCGRVRDERDWRDWREAGLVYLVDLVCLVYSVCLVDRTGKPASVVSLK